MRAVLRIALIVVLCMAGINIAIAQGEYMTFRTASDLDKVQVEGSASIDKAKNREGGKGGALKVDAGSEVVWRLRNTDGSGTVEMWTFEDGSSPDDPKKRAAGPLWGLVQKTGGILTVGAIYAPYLSGDTTYAASDFDPAKNERPWWKVQYLGLKRQKGWHKWTFLMDPEKGLTILYDDRDVNSSREMFNWNRTGLRGFSGVVIRGGAAEAKQTIWVDDVKVVLGAPMVSTPLWPPPPPSNLAPLAWQAAQMPAPYASWKNGPSQSPDFFPIAVWLQAPKNAKRYKEAGFNLYIGLWKGPTEEQLAALKEAEMSVICAQNDVGLSHINDKIIVGWMHGDEPDNAQRRPDGKGYGPPIVPDKIIEDYQRIKTADRSRPVVLNLGQGVAWDAWRGRGVRTNHPEDYLEYAKGCDIASFDIYPVVHTHSSVTGRLWYVPFGVTRLRKWTGDSKIVWNCIECTRISNPNTKPTPKQVRAEVWMSIIFGSRGLIYFVHQFKPTFVEPALLQDTEMLQAVTTLNKQIHSLAPVINSPTVTGGATVRSSSPNVPVRIMVKRHGAAIYVFAVALYHQKTTATFKVAKMPASAVAEVIGEERTIKVHDGLFTDELEGYDVHIYKIR